jgi:hypothetical protein
LIIVVARSLAVYASHFGAPAVLEFPVRAKAVHAPPAMKHSFIGRAEARPSEGKKLV